MPQLTARRTQALEVSRCLRFDAQTRLRRTRAPRSRCRGPCRPRPWPWPWPGQREEGEGEKAPDARTHGLNAPDRSIAHRPFFGASRCRGLRSVDSMLRRCLASGARLAGSQVAGSVGTSSSTLLVSQVFVARSFSSVAGATDGSLGKAPRVRRLVGPAQVKCRCFLMRL